MLRKLSPALKRELFTLPNVLTYLRIGMIPFVIFFLMLSDRELVDLEWSQWASFVAFLLFSLAAITDYLDGWIARSRDEVTIVGKFIDPVADKLIVLAVLVALVELQRVESWIVILILLREVSINGLRTLAIAEGLQIDVNKMGKFKTAFQLFGIQGLILNYTYQIPLIPDEVSFNLVGRTLVLISLLFSFLSAGSYFRGFMRAIQEKYDKIGGE